MDGSCARCGQNIPAWLTFTLGRGGRTYCSEYCQRLDEESEHIPERVRQAAEHNARADDVRAGEQARSGEAGAAELAGDADGLAGVRKRLRFLSRLR